MSRNDIRQYLGHLLFSLLFCLVRICVVISLYENQVVGLVVDDKLAGCVLYGRRHLVEDCPELLQC